MSIDRMAYELYLNDSSNKEPFPDAVIVFDGFVKYKNHTNFRKYYTMLRKQKLQNIITINNMEKRMYFFVPYQLTDIQKGIQCGHVALEYAKIYNNDVDFIDFRDNWKTWIVLNGGTTNNNPERLGSLNLIFRNLIDNEINCEAFYEPDLGDQMTAICFICDERVFNKELYPDYSMSFNGVDWNTYENWCETIGNQKNIFLRELLSDKKLA